MRWNARFALLFSVALVHMVAGQVLAGALNDGRRLQAGGAGLVVLTDPVLDRVVIYDVNGDVPRKVAAFGVPGLLPGQFESPHGAALNEFRELFVADTANHRIQVFDLGPIAMGGEPRLVRVWGTQGGGSAALDTPSSGITIPSRGAEDHLVYVGDTGNDRIQVFDRFGRPAGVTIGGRGSDDGRLSRPGGMASDPAGRVLYVVDRGNRRVAAFDAKSGAFLFKFGHAGSGEGALVAPEGIAVDASGVVLVADPGSGRVARFKPATGAGTADSGMRYDGAWGFVGTKPGSWTHPQSLAVDGKDRVYVADGDDGRCQMFSKDGVFLGAFGTDVELAKLTLDDTGAGNTLPATLCSNGARYQLRLQSKPSAIPYNALFEIEVQIAEGCVAPKTLTDATLAVDAVMPEHRHGMNTQPEVLSLGNGRFRVQGLMLHMAGLWELYFDVARGGVTERAQVGIALE
jgi:sugar lactone lactonase YvrE